MPSRDWRSAAAYADLENASARDLAWEFLRRNPRYVRDWEQLDDRRPDDAASAVAERWGLRFRGRPGAGRGQRKGHLGADHPLRRDRRERLEALRTGDGRDVPHHLNRQVERELDRLELLLNQIKAVEGERDAMLAEERLSSREVAVLSNVVGVGPEFAAVLWSEGLYRRFDNRRQVAAYAGLAPTPWQSGSIDREQGIGKSGNPRLRATLLEMSWLWLRHQPASALSRWFNTRVAQNGGRFKKVMITALARKLVVALWKYVTAGVVIEGAVVRA